MLATPTPATIPADMTAIGLAATIVTVLANGVFSYLRDARRERREERRAMERTKAIAAKIDENTKYNIDALETANHANEKIARSYISTTEVLEELRAVRRTGDETRGMVDRLDKSLADTRRDVTVVRTTGEETRSIVDRLVGRMFAANEIRLSGD